MQLSSKLVRQAAQCSHTSAVQCTTLSCLASATDGHCAVAHHDGLPTAQIHRHVAGAPLLEKRCRKRRRLEGGESGAVGQHGAGEVPPNAAAGEGVKLGSASGSADALAEAAQEQFEQFLQGAHQMTACALAAIDACSADVPQTVHFLELLAQQGSDRHKKQECLESLQSSFEKHMTEYEEEEQKYTQNLWGSMSTQQQDLQVRLDIGNRLQTLRLQKQKLGEALLWLELMSGPPAI